MINYVLGDNVTLLLSDYSYQWILIAPFIKTIILKGMTWHLKHIIAGTESILRT